MQRTEPAQVIAELGLGELGLSRLGFAPTEITRPESGVAGYGPRYGWVEDFTAVLYDEEADMAGLINLEIERLASFSHTFYWRNRDGSAVDLTGASARMDIRAEQDSTSAHKATIASYSKPVGGSDPWFDAIDITADEGKLLIALSPANTALIAAGNWWYDLKITLSGGEVYRLVQGRVKVDEAVTP